MHLAGLKSPIYYVVGPPGMVNVLHRLLNQAGVDDEEIRSEIVAATYRPA